MNELQLINENGKIYVDSRQVAKMIGKRHDNLIRDIDGYVNILGQTSKLRTDNFFVKSSYQAGTGKTYPCYNLTRKGCDMVANKLTGEKGVLFTAEYVTKFEEMEKQIKMQQLLPDFNNPVEAARAWANEVEAKQKALVALEQVNKELEEAKPKLTYYDTILNSVGTMTSSQIGADYGMSAIKLNRILNEQKLIKKVNNQWILYAKYQNQGLTESKTFDVEHGSIVGSYVSTRWTQKGRLKIHEILTKLGYVANVDKSINRMSKRDKFVAQEKARQLSHIA
ncbi:Rha family transcriptional regulator [Megamonas funiformis]|jgi:Rha family phage regulatory protein|uniref:Rha family transcriptional regulator n=1 Tax=Megamonas funiformis TaxID=437897 RepID=UPI00266FFA46|nr:Rha family transcriptional regulator [Megamonas funiformis]